MKNIAHWCPAGFCAFLSLSVLVTNFVLGRVTDNSTFYCFLPMCFYFVGAATSRMSGEIRELKAQIAALQGKESA